MDILDRNWRQVVQPGDVVIHLGDVAVGHKRELKTYLDSLPGTKILVMGNHDTHSTLWYMRHGFAFATYAISYQGVTFTHVPVETLFPGTDLNIHGHIHNSPWFPTKEFQRLLAIEHVGYRPVDLRKWVNMARSSRRWHDYLSTWRGVIPRIERRTNARNEP
jgi:calcineurin-like phosphoesterase family protein